jgi:hypothetical protein
LQDELGLVFLFGFGMQEVFVGGALAFHSLSLWG